MVDLDWKAMYRVVPSFLIPSSKTAAGSLSIAPLPWRTMHRLTTGLLLLFACLISLAVVTGSRMDDSSVLLPGDQSLTHVASSAPNFLHQGPNIVDGSSGNAFKPLLTSHNAVGVHKTLPSSGSGVGSFSSTKYA